MGLGFDREQIGFSNSRMAYDDVLAKFAVTLELNTLSKKITANSITERYRDDSPFSDAIVQSVQIALRRLYQASSDQSGLVKLNKASFLSWLIFLKRADDWGVENTSKFLRDFEANKINASAGHNFRFEKIFVNLCEVYQDRVSSRVADTSSVILRDLSLWLSFCLYRGARQVELAKLEELKDWALSVERSHPEDLEAEMLEYARKLSWGEGLCSV